MEETITIKTDGAGVRLYNSSVEGIEFYSKHIDELNSWCKSIQSLKENYGDLAAKVGIEDLEMLINFDGLLSIAIADLHLISRELYLSKSQFQQSFYIKHAYLIIYETYNNFKNKQAAIRKMAIECGKDIADQHSDVLKLWKMFVKEFEMDSAIKDVRHTIGAHIHHDFSVWYDEIGSLDVHHATNMLIVFVNVITQLQRLAATLAEVSSNKLKAINQASRKEMTDMIDRMEEMIRQTNEKQGEGPKLDIDLSILRKLIS